MSEKQSYTERVTAESDPVQKPEGSPDLWPLMKLPRRKRADVLRRLNHLQGLEETFVKLSGEEDDATLDAAADVYDALAEIEEFLASVAAPGADVTTWASEASDEELMALFAWYAETLQPGEAPASPTS